MTLTLSRLPPPTPVLNARTVAALAALVLLAHGLVAWTLLHLAQAPSAVAPAKVLEVSWIAPPQPLLQPQPLPQPTPAQPSRPQPPAPRIQRPSPVAPAPRPLAPVPAATHEPVPVNAPPPAAAVAPPQPVAAAPVPPPVAAPAPQQIATSALRYLEPLKPVYPRVSADLCETGVVTLAILVNEWGVPVEVQIEKSSGYPRLDQSALTAMRAARFKPYTEGGQARPIRAHPTINFQLDC